MTTNDLDSAGLVGTGGTPTQPVSTGATAADSTGEASLADAMKLLKELQGHVRSLQSEKDKGVRNVQAEVKSLSDQLKQYEKYRVKFNDPEEAARQMEIDNLLVKNRGDIDGLQAAQTGKAGTPTSVSSADYAGFASDLGLSINDSEVLAAIQEGSRPDVYRKLITIADKRKAPVAPTNPAPLPVSGGLPVAGEATLEDVTSELNAEMSKTVLDMTKIRALRDRQAKLLPRK